MHAGPVAPVPRPGVWRRAAGWAVAALVPLMFWGMLARVEWTGDRIVASRFLPAEGRRALVFFGFVGCPKECPETLVRVARAYRDLEKSANPPDFWFVSLRPAEPQSSVEAYARHFYPAFHGVALDTRALAAELSAFGISGDDSTHRASIHVLERREGRWHLVRSIPFGAERDEELRGVLAGAQAS